MREARAAARLRHPNVASVFHYGEQDGECFYAMELVEGETLEERVRRDGPLSVEAALEVGIQVARALVEAEAQGLVHRDLKPSNIMLVTTPTEGLAGGESLLVKVIDFGLAKGLLADDGAGESETRRGFAGTPAYASPEQFSGGEQPVNIRSDIYSLGVTLWYALSGRVPFPGRSLEEIRDRQIEQPPPLEHLAAHKVPAPTVRLLCAMLAPDPGARPAPARELLGRLHHCREQSVRKAPWQTRAGKLRRGVLLLGVAAVIAGAVFWSRRVGPPAAPVDKSIAVLPFENLSPDPADAYFTQGVGGEIRQNLSYIADLKLIDVSAPGAYPPGQRDLAKIGRELGVWHLLEGSLRREDGQVHVQIRVIDLRDPTRNWTARYDRLLTDVFAVQSEITRAVAARLGAKLSRREEVMVDDPPTRDLAAYDFYLRADVGMNLVNTIAERAKYNRDVRIPLLEAAVARDPGFAVAYCELASAHDWLQKNDPGTPVQGKIVDHRSLAEAALAKARRLRPKHGQVHLAQAVHFWYANGDNAQARAEVELARDTLPNSAEVEMLAGNLARSEGRWEKGRQCIERSLALDPRNAARRFTLAVVNYEMHSYAEAEGLLDRVIAETEPDARAPIRLFRARIRLDAQADPAPIQAVLDALTPEETRRFRAIRDGTRISLALYAHDADAVSRALSERDDASFAPSGFVYPKAWLEGLAARLRQDRAGAQSAFRAAREEVDRRIQARASDGRLWGLLAMIDAGLGNKDEAVREARHACELTPLEQSAEEAPLVATCLAVVYAWTDQRDLACAVLEEWADRPCERDPLTRPSYGELRLCPLWDFLKGDPRFEALIQRLAPDRKR